MERLTRRTSSGFAMIADSLSECDAEIIIDILADRLATYEDTGLEPEEILELKSFTQGGVHKVDEGWLHVQNLLQAEKDGRLVVWGCCDYCYYDDDHSHCPPGVDSLECGVECFGCVCGECEKGSRFKAALKGGDEG